MTILAEDVAKKYKVLELLLKDVENISENEADIIIQVCIHILSGLRSRNNILEIFTRSAEKVQDSERFGKVIDQYKILKSLIELINK